MKPQLPKPRTNRLRVGLSGNALLVLNILDDLEVCLGQTVSLKPIYLQWAIRGRRGGTELSDALEELADAGNIAPVNDRTTLIERLG